VTNQVTALFGPIECDARRPPGVSSPGLAGTLYNPLMPARHHEVTRLEGFSDTVFGFALTLLVVSLEVPSDIERLTLQSPPLPTNDD